MLYGVRDQVQEELKALRHELKAEFKGQLSKVEHRFGKVDARFSAIHEEFGKVHASIEALTSHVHHTNSEVHRIAILVEDQNAKNSIVLDGLVSLFHRQDRVERDVADIKQFLLKAK